MHNQTTTTTTAPAEIEVNGVRYVRSEVLSTASVPLLEQLVNMPLHSNLRSLRIFCILAEEYQFYYRSKDADITQPMLTVPHGDRPDFHRLEVLLMELASQYFSG